MIKLYNTLTKKLEGLPKKDHVNLYTCGPTVYNYAHIGNLRSYILADLLYRTLKYEGYNPKWVMNITDIDDKTIKGAIGKYGSDAGVAQLREFTDFYLDEFLKDLSEVNVSKDDITFIRVTDVIPQTQEFIMGLIEKGYAYKADDGSTYFSIDKYQKDFGDYGQLVGEKFIEGKKVGARVAVDEYEKDNLSDFALWKAWDSSVDGNIYWDHPELGKGRPGWHIECSVINQIGFKGEPTDIHTGGVDLVFPHHTNEIAQSQALVGKGNFVHHWFHSEHLLVDDQRMGKRFNNFYTIKDLTAKGFSGQDLRYFFLTSAYNNRQNFTFPALAAAKTSKDKLLGLPETDEAFKSFDETLEDNLNLPEALAAIWSDGKFSKGANQVFGFHQETEIEATPEVQALIGSRQEARAAKDFNKSDDLRKQIEDLGYELMDTPEGQKVKKKLKI